MKPDPELEELLGSIDADFGYAVGNLNMDTKLESREEIIKKLQQWGVKQRQKTYDQIMSIHMAHTWNETSEDLMNWLKAEQHDLLQLQSQLPQEDV